MVWPQHSSSRKSCIECPTLQAAPANATPYQDNLTCTLKMNMAAQILFMMIADSTSVAHRLLPVGAASPEAQDSPAANIFDKCCQVWVVDGRRIVRMCFLHPVDFSRTAMGFGCAGDNLHARNLLPAKVPDGRQLNAKGKSYRFRLPFHQASGTTHMADLHDMCAWLPED